MFLDVAVEFATLIQVTDYVVTVFVFEPFKDPHNVRVVQLRKDADFRVGPVDQTFALLKGVQAGLVNDFDGSKTACLAMDAESNVAIATLFSYLLTYAVDFADVGFCVFCDKVLHVNFELIHPFLNVLLRLVLLSLYANATSSLLISNRAALKHH